MNPVSLIPYVCGAGASLPGCEYGPLYCRDHGLTERLAELGIDAVWHIDPQTHWNGPYGQAAHSALPPRGSSGRHEIAAWHCQSICGNVEAALRLGQRVVTIGGDHSMAAGSVAGAAKAFGPDSRLGLIWVDAHPDINTTRSSLSRALHGMSVAALLGIDDELSSLGAEGATLSPRNVLYAGLRDIDDSERQVAMPLGVNLLTMAELRAQGVARTLQDSVMQMATRCDHMVLSIDLDAFSSDIAPAVGTPVPDGFMPDEILPVLAGIVRAHSIPLIEIVEFNPTLPGAEQTFSLMVEILRTLLPANTANHL